MGYTQERPPEYIEPLLDEYDLEVDSCGYRGAWVKVRSESGVVFQFRREVVNDVRISGKGPAVTVTTHISAVDYSNVVERHELLGEALMDEVGGFESLDDAVEALQY